MYKIIPIVLALSLTGCASLQNPFVNSRFDSATWKADIAVVKAAVKTGGQAVLDVMDELCPQVGPIHAAVNDPANAATAQAYLGSASAVQKNLNNINDGLLLLNNACAIHTAASARVALVAGAQAINDAKTIYSTIKR